MNIVRQTMLAPGHVDDLFLSPHPDDVCFSVGYLASRRAAGRLLTVFPGSYYRVEPGLRSPLNTDATTAERLGEDVAFGEACGLRSRFLKFNDAMARNQPVFGLQNVHRVTEAIQDRLCRSLVGPRVGVGAAVRPWLFCPVGIGGHVDHVAVLLVVLKNLQMLTRFYRVAFYEDLYYASFPEWRTTGLTAFFKLLNGQRVERVDFPLDEEGRATKLGLISHYRSQLTPEMTTIEAYAPAVPGPSMPHEAVWLFEVDIESMKASASLS